MNKNKILIILISVSLISIIFMEFLKLNNQNSIFKTLIKNNDYSITLKKKNNDAFTDSELKEIGVEYKEIYKLNDSNYKITVNTDKNNSAYYSLLSDRTLKFKELTSEEYKNINIIGNIPTKPNEVLIHKILADYIIENGTIINNNENLNNSDTYKPTSYEELITSQKQIKYGNNFIIITGIIDEDLSKYEELKTKTNDNLYKEFENNYKNKINEVVINNNFFNNFGFNILDNKVYTNTLNYQNNDYNVKLGYITTFNNIDIYDGLTYKTSIDLQNNEIVVDLNFINILTKGKLLESWNNIKENTKLNDFIIDFLKENNILNTKATLKTDKIKELSNKEVTIKGIILTNLDEDKYFTSPEIYVNEKLIKQYANKIETKELLINIKNKQEIKTLLKNKNYIIETKNYTNLKEELNNENKIIITLRNILVIITIILALILLFKNIGLLKKAKKYKLYKL